MLGRPHRALTQYAPFMRTRLLLRSVARVLEILHCEASFRSVVPRDLMYDSYGVIVMPAPKKITRRLVQRKSE
jgi:hypothetical protein